jgi:hypothetical protein
MTADDIDASPPTSMTAARPTSKPSPKPSPRPGSRSSTSPTTSTTAPNPPGRIRGHEIAARIRAAARGDR